MAKQTSPRTADPLTSLEQDHRAVEQLFERLRGAKGGEARLRIFLQIKDALGLHATLEEHILYPALRSMRDEVTQVLATQAFDEHDEVKGRMAVIEVTPPEDPVFLAHCVVLQAHVARHVRMEEEELFPRGRKLLGDTRLEDLGRRLAGTRAEHARAARKDDLARARKP